MKLMYEKVNKIRDILLPYGSTRRIFIKKVYKRILKFIDDDCDKNPNKTNNESIFSYDLRNCKIYNNVIILAAERYLFVAELIVQCLQKVAIASHILVTKPEEGYQDLLHIVICPHMFIELPEKYIVFRVEQALEAQHFTERYVDLLKESLAVLDYSLHGIACLQKKNNTAEGIGAGKLFYVPISYNRNLHEKYSTVKKEYDVIFWGDDSCLRWKQLLDYLGDYYRIKVINNTFGENLYQELSKSKIIINIHSNADAVLEVTRIYECLSLATSIIISEKSMDMEEYPLLKNIVEFVDAGDFYAVKEKIGCFLNNKDLYHNKLEMIKAFVTNKKATSFEYYFYRFLLATDNIDFDTFYSNAESFIELKNKFWCLGLPESVDRKKTFDDNNKYGIEYYPGLRHYFGWVGCGLSYKFLLHKARSLNLPYVIICEDDVSFKDDFSYKFEIIKKFLLCEDNDWDIFSGLIADVHKKTTIHSIQTYKGFDFIKIDKMTSTVFNIYNERFMDKLDNWDYMDRNVDSNTIDRYMEGNAGVKIITLLPFLVGCQDELQSTLWNFQNTQYNKMIENSVARLEAKINEYRNNL